MKTTPQPVTRFHNLDAKPEWSIADADEIYQISRWGEGYFSINDAGHVVIRPSMDPSREIDLYDVVQGLKRDGRASNSC